MERKKAAGIEYWPVWNKIATVLIYGTGGMIGGYLVAVSARGIVAAFGWLKPLGVLLFVLVVIGSMTAEDYMPKAMEEGLRDAGRKKGFTGERLDRYVYGYMNKHGYMKGNKTTAKGESADDQAEALSKPRRRKH